MRYFKLLLISITVFALILFGMSLLFPSSVVISRAVDISANSTEAYKYINSCASWKLWVAQLKDPSLTVLSDTKIHSSKFEINITDKQSDKIVSEWKDNKGLVQHSTMRIITSPTLPNATTVQWQFEENIHWYQPWEKFASLVGDQILGTMMEDNLNNLKKILETN